MGGYFQAYLRNASIVLDHYRHQEPFSVFLKQFFRLEKKYGSRDRKVITDLCYGYLRLGHAIDKISLQDAIVIGYYLTHNTDNGFLASVKPEWSENILETLSNKLKFIKRLYPDFQPNSIFPGISDLSPSMDVEKWTLKHLSKPGFFLRIRPGNTDKVRAVLDEKGVVYDLLANDAIRIHSNLDLSEILMIDKDCLVQDIASQKTSELFSNISIPIQSFWDACAGSGGKSIMVHDLFPHAKVFVSDIRDEILEELKRRFRIAGVKAEKTFCNDLTHPMAEQVIKSNLPSQGVDLIIADVPCSGSGTWGRTPEWLTSFEIPSIESYSRIQKILLTQLTGQLRKGNFLLYITCSVYEAENEKIVSYATENLPVELIKAEHLSGEEFGGDHLFAALFISAL
jgi:16S rRNA (cytosine967-C5)-methyltransferase